jgi:hypothetical protein
MSPGPRWYALLLRAQCLAFSSSPYFHINLVAHYTLHGYTGCASVSTSVEILNLGSGSPFLLEIWNMVIPKKVRQRLLG